MIDEAKDRLYVALRACMNDRATSWGDWKVYAFLIDYAKGGRGPIRPSRQRIADEVGINLLSVSRCIKRLVSLGYLTMKASVGRSTNIYWLPKVGDTGNPEVTVGEETYTGNPSATAPVTCGLPLRDGDTGNPEVTPRGDDTGNPQVTRLLGADIAAQADAFADHAGEVVDSKGSAAGSRRAKRPTSSEGFAGFWSAYPKKVSKADALKAWLKADLDEVADQIERHVRERAANDPAWEDVQFIPYPATFLRARRWEDDWKPIARRQREQMPKGLCVADRVAWINEQREIEERNHVVSTQDGWGLDDDEAAERINRAAALLDARKR